MKEGRFNQHHECMTENSLTNPHDRFFRRTYDVTANAGALLANLLPPELLAQVDLSSLQREPDTFVDAAHRRNSLDLFYSARFKTGTEVLFYLLLEHKSYRDPYTALQVFRYVLQVFEWLRRNGRPLCVVIPIVIYHGRDKWEEPITLRGRIEGPEDFQQFVPDMGVLLFDLSQIQPGVLQGTPDFLARIQVMQWIRKEQRNYAELRQIVSLLKTYREIRSHGEALLDIILYITAVTERDHRVEIVRAVEDGLDAETGLEKLSMTTILEEMISEWREEGREEGHEAGLGEGELIGRILALQQCCGLPVSASVQLRTVPVAELQEMVHELERLFQSRR